MVEDYIHNRMPEYIQTLYDVITIPSPTGEEGEKARWILDQLKAMGAEGACQDEAGNVIFLIVSRAWKSSPCTPPIWIRCLQGWRKSCRKSTAIP